MAKHGPYDVIFLEGAAQAIPAKVLDQLKDGGRIVAIMTDGHLGQCKIGHKRGSAISWAVEFDATAPVLAGFEAVEEFTFA